MTAMTKMTARWAWLAAAAAVMVTAIGAGPGCSTTRAAMKGESVQTWNMNVSPQLPGATGKVKVIGPDEGNLRLTVEVEHLAQPQQVFDGATTYVVWVVPQGGDPQNVGGLNVGEDLKAKLETRTPFRTFEVVVTAESSPNVVSPSDKRVLYVTISAPT
jgi:hypothetical protein